MLIMSSSWTYDRSVLSCHHQEPASHIYLVLIMIGELTYYLVLTCIYPLKP